MTAAAHEALLFWEFGRSAPISNFFFLQREVHNLTGPPPTWARRGYEMGRGVPTRAGPGDVLDGEGLQALPRTRPWVRLVAVVGS